MKACTGLLVVAALLTAAPARAQDPEPQSRILATGLGAVAGLAGGGYVTVAVVVAESRRGKYVHDFDDILGWRTAPALIGAAAGAGLGFFSPERLQGAIVYGAGGLALGAAVGLAVGSRIGEGPEARWAGAAIGAGIGLVLGNTVGVLRPLNLFTEGDDNGAAGASGVPITFRIPL